MDSPRTLIEELFIKVETYLKTAIELAKLKGLETAIAVIASLIWKLIVIVFLSLFVIMLSIGAAIWLGDILGKWYYGFAIVSVFYLIAGLFFQFFMLGWIRKQISRAILSQTLNKK